MRLMTPDLMCSISGALQDRSDDGASVRSRKPISASLATTKLIV